MKLRRIMLVEDIREKEVQTIKYNEFQGWTFRAKTKKEITKTFMLLDTATNQTRKQRVRWCIIQVTKKYVKVRIY